MAIKNVFINQIGDAKSWAHLTKRSHLGMTGQDEPVYIRNKMIDRIYEMNVGADSLASFIDKLPTMELPKDGEYRWKLKGTNERNIPLVKATIDEAGTTTVTDDHKAGQAGGVFYLWFNEDLFYATSVLTSLHPEMYSVRCMGEGIQIGNLVRYAVQLTTRDADLFVPASELLAGSRWVENYGLVEPELSIRGNSVNFSTAFDMWNTTSMLRKNYQVPGNMITTGENYPLRFDFVTDKGQTFSKWLPYLDWEFHNQFRRDKARLILNGKATVLSNGNAMIKGESGNPVVAGFGLYEQMNGGNVEYYNQFSAKNLEKFIRDISFNKIPEDKRKIVVSTGEYGAAQFHESIMNLTGGNPYSNYLRSDRNFKGMDTWEEGQIINYKGILGIEISLVVDKMKDDMNYNTMMHPNGGPVSSYIYDIFDFGTTNGEPNIKKVVVKGQEEIYGYIPGLRDPFQPYNNLGSPRLMATSKDGYEVHKAWVGGVCIINPLKTARYIPTMYV